MESTDNPEIELNFIGKKVCCWNGGEIPLYVTITHIAKHISKRIESNDFYKESSQDVIYVGKTNDGRTALAKPSIMLCNILGKEKVLIRWHSCPWQYVVDKDNDNIMWKDIDIKGLDISN